MCELIVKLVCDEMNIRRCTKKSIAVHAHLLYYHERPEQIAHGCSFVMSDLSDSLTVALCLERPERFAHSCSFVLSDLSESLTVAHLV